MTVDYGFASTDNVEFDKIGGPVGEYTVRIAEEYVDEKISEKNPNPVVVLYEILDGEFKGKTFKNWYNVHNANPTTANIAKQSIKRIAEATGRAVTPTAPLHGRVFKVIVDEQKNDSSRTDIKKYLPADAPASSSAAPF